MADGLSLLQALQGGLYKPQESGYGIASQVLGGSVNSLYNPYDSPGANLTNSLGAGLLAGLLGGYARHDAAQENAALIPQMTQLMTVPAEERAAIAASNPRLSPLVQALAFEDFSSKQKQKEAVADYQVKMQYEPQVEIAKFQALNPLEQQRNIDNKIVDAGFSQGVVPTQEGILPFEDIGLKNPITVDVDKTKQVEQAKIDIEDARYGERPPEAVIPPKDAVLLEQKYTDELTKGAQATNVIEMNKAVLNISDALNRNNPLAATTAIFEYAKLQDPKGTVREADEMRVSDPGGPLGALAQLHNIIMKEGKLTLDAKKAMADLIPNLQANAFSQYDQVRDNLKASAKAYGADPNRIQFIKPAQIPVFKAEEITDALLPQPGESKADFIARIQAGG